MQHQVSIDRLRHLSNRALGNLQVEPIIEEPLDVEQTRLTLPQETSRAAHSKWGRRFR